MNVKILISILALFSVMQGLNAETKPVYINNVETSGGAGPRDYFIVRTTIKKNPSDTETAPIVIREKLGVLKESQSSILINQAIKVPKGLTDLAGTAGVDVAKLTGMLSQAAGTIGSSSQDPKAQAIAAGASVAIGAAGVIADVGMKVAGKLMDKFFEKDPSGITFLEIIPSGYYVIEGDAIKPTQDLLDAIVKVDELKKEYRSFIEKFNQTYANYSYAYNVAAIKDKYHQMGELWTKIDSYYKTTIVPLLKEKLDMEKKLAQYPIYRCALSATNISSGSCNSLQLCTYVGAKLTDVSAIAYCAATSTPNCNFIVVIPTVLTAGGIKLSSSDGSMTFSGQKTSPYIEWTQALFGTDVSQGEIERYLIPFKINEMNEAIAQAQKEKHDASFDAVAEKFSQALETYKDLKKRSIEKAETAQEKAKAEELTAQKKLEQEHAIIVQELNPISEGLNKLQEQFGADLDMLRNSRKVLDTWQEKAAHSAQQLISLSSLEGYTPSMKDEVATLATTELADQHDKIKVFATTKFPDLVSALKSLNEKFKNEITKMADSKAKTELDALQTKFSAFVADLASKVTVLVIPQEQQLTALKSKPTTIGQLQTLAQTLKNLSNQELGVSQKLSAEISQLDLKLQGLKDIAQQIGTALVKITPSKQIESPE